MPAEPLIFLKPPSSLIASGDSIVYPATSQNVHYEGELGVVIGVRARHVTAAEAENYIFGYTCVNDVTARDLQRKDVQFTRAKGFDTFCPAGPWIVRREDVVLENLRVRTLLDGEVRQDASVRDMIFPVSAIIAFVNAVYEARAGRPDRDRHTARCWAHADWFYRLDGDRRHRVLRNPVVVA